ncbi:MAG TPA: FAD-dependent oxidoreductase [Solirubrobacteraceae bacterium]|nr:FAD-dependent oxidoreductase [Solirubrobacteraceae bacterium]
MGRPIVIAGASLAGLRAAQAIRGAGHDGRVVVVGAEEHLPYTRPPLSKELLAGAQEAEHCALPSEKVDVEWRLGTRATALDLARRELVLGDERLAYEKLLIATGARPRHWPGDPIELDGVFMLRDLDDALALRAAFAERPRLAVVGAGFIGCEVAATARKLGLDVTLIDVAPLPMTALGRAVGERCAELHRAHGVDLRLGAGVDGFEGAGRLEAVRLAGGARVAADVAVVALGAIPNTDWLADSGLELQPGVVCDATLAARDAQDVFCAGDAAAWPHPMADGALIRIEHWTNAAEQGAAAARNLLAAPDERTPYVAVPYFWSDQYDVKIQSVGLPARAERVTVLESSPDGERIVLGGERAGRLVAAIGFNAARRLAFYRGRLAAMPPFDEVVAAVRADEKALGDPAAAVA